MSVLIYFAAVGVGNRYQQEHNMVTIKNQFKTSSNYYYYTDL